MSSGGGDEGCGLILLVLVVSFIPVVIVGWIAWKLLKYIDEHPEEVADFFIGVAKVIVGLLLAPHYAVVLVALYLSRDLVVQHWAVQNDQSHERQAVLFWVMGIPIFLAITWLGLASWFFGLFIPPTALAIFLGLLSTLTLLACYYYQYFERPPQHHKWPLFMAQEEHLWFDARLAYVEYRARLQLWWHSLAVRNE